MSLNNLSNTAAGDLIIIQWGYGGLFWNVKKVEKVDPLRIYVDGVPYDRTTGDIKADTDKDFEFLTEFSNSKVCELYELDLLSSMRVEIREKFPDFLDQASPDQVKSIHQMVTKN